MVFNREYQRRAARQALSALGLELVRHPESGFYRPAKRTNPKTGRKETAVGAVQLKLDFDPDRPLADIFPEAYE